MMRVIHEVFQQGLLVERTITDYEPDPAPPASAAVAEPSENTSPLVSMREWLASHGRGDTA